MSYTNTFDLHHLALLAFSLEQPLFTFVLMISQRPLLTGSPLSQAQLPGCMVLSQFASLSAFYQHFKLLMPPSFVERFLYLVSRTGRFPFTPLNISFHTPLQIFSSARPLTLGMPWGLILRSSYLHTLPRAQMISFNLMI